MTTRRERRLWLAAAALLAAIYLSLYPMRFVVEALRERGLLRLAVAAVFALSAAAVAALMARRGAGWREWAVLAAAAAVYVAVLVATERHEERVHFLEYGLFAGLVHAALEERRRRVGGALARAPALTAFAVTAAAGWSDEGIQALLPNRYYDLRDVGLNAVAGALAIATLVALQRARRRDRETG